MPEPAQSWCGLAMKVASSPCARAAAFTARFNSKPSSAAATASARCLQIDLELAGTRLLHDRVDGETLHLANAVDVVDERRQRVHLLKAEGERPARIVGETFRGVKRECAIGGPAGDIELELDRGDRRLAGAGQIARPGRSARHAGRAHPWRRRPSRLARACRRRQGSGPASREKVAVVVAIAGLPQAARSPPRNCRAGP